MRWIGTVMCIVSLMLLPTACTAVTQTVVGSRGTMSITRMNLTLLEFRNPYLHPQATLEFVIEDSELDIDVDTSCRSQIANIAFSSVDDNSPWLTSVVQPDAISARKVTVNETSAYYVLTVPISGNDDFEPGVFTFSLPNTCTLNALPPNDVVFQVIREDRRALGRIMSFAVLLSSGVAALNTLAGSVTALVPMQLFATLANCGCNALPLQEEGNIIKYVIAPIHVRISGLSSAASVVVFQSLLLVCLWAAEGLRGLWIVVQRRLAESSDKQRNHDSDEDEEDKSKEAKSPREGANEPKQSSSPSLKPPYIGAAVHLSVLMGMVLWSVPSLDSDSTPVQGLSVAVLLMSIIGTPVGCLAVARNSSFVFHQYQAQKGKIPRWLQPNGIWGPNELRMSYGFFVEDFADNGKVFGAVFTLARVFLALLYGTNPTNVGGCRTVKYVNIATVTGLVVLVYLTKPMRSTFLNMGFVASQSVFLVFSLVEVIHSGFYYDDPEHWSATATLGVGMTYSIGMVGFALAQSYSILWEVAGKRGIRHVRSQNKKTRVVERYDDDVNDMVAEMSLMFRDGNCDMRNADLLQESEGQANADGRRPQKKRGAMSLADYLLEDYDAVPLETREEFKLAAHYHQEQKTQTGLLGPMIIHPSDRPQTRNNAYFMEANRSVPPNLSTHKSSIL